MEFEPFPKIPRLRRDFVITEKIDGTNAAVCFDEDGDLTVQSRKRIITPTEDNYQFAEWAYLNKATLWEDLGPGRHFGEWWGLGIGRRYGLDHKRFSLFNVNRWQKKEGHFATPNVGVVPVLHRGNFDSQAVSDCLSELSRIGSVAAPGFMDPEGVVVYHTQARLMFKVTCKNDEMSKGEADARAKVEP